MTHYFIIIIFLCIMIYTYIQSNITILYIIIWDMGYGLVILYHI